MAAAQESSSRRTVLASALGGLAGVIASALSRPMPAEAANGDAVILGSTSNVSTNGTRITNSSATVDVFAVEASGSGATALAGTATGSNGVAVAGSSGPGTGVSGAGGAYGVFGNSASGVGVIGESETGTAVVAESTSGIGLNADSVSGSLPAIGARSRGFSTGIVASSGGAADPLPAAKANTGVYGYEGGSGVGVWGATGGSTGAGTGVKGEANSPDGIGVSGTGNNGGTGLKGDGRVGVFASSTTDGWMAMWGRHFGAGYGVAGDSISLIGVSGSSNATDHPAIAGKSQGNSTGVLGFSGASNAALPAARAKTGLLGVATQDSSARGVVGVSTSGQGVRGEASTGAAVYGTASNTLGYAIRGSGRVRFDKVSGVATIAANATSVTVTPGTDVTTDSFVLLTAKANIGTRSLYFSTDATANTITIRMSSSRTTSTPIAWLLLS